MDSLSSYCGIDCNRCPAYISFINNDDELREKTARRWNEMYQKKYSEYVSLLNKNEKQENFNPQNETFKYQFKKEDINCEGCKKGTIHVYYCSSICNIRRCAISKNIDNCGLCSEYPCMNISDLINEIPSAKENLEKFHKKL